MPRKNLTGPSEWFEAFLKSTDEKDLFVQWMSRLLEHFFQHHPLTILDREIRVLDLGIGDGLTASRIAALLRRYYCNVAYIGLDREERFVQSAQEQLNNIEGVTPCVQHIDFNNNLIDQYIKMYPPFHIVVVSHVVYYLQNPSAFLAILKRLADRGTIILFAHSPATAQYMLLRYWINEIANGEFNARASNDIQTAFPSSMSIFSHPWIRFSAENLEHNNRLREFIAQTSRQNLPHGYLERLGRLMWDSRFPLCTQFQIVGTGAYQRALQRSINYIMTWGGFEINLSPLHMAAYQGQVEIFERIATQLGLGAINMPNIGVINPLMLAVLGWYHLWRRSDTTNRESFIRLFAFFNRSEVRAHVDNEGYRTASFLLYFFSTLFRVKPFTAPMRHIRPPQGRAQENGNTTIGTTLLFATPRHFITMQISVRQLEALVQNAPDMFTELTLGRFVIDAMLRNNLVVLRILLEHTVHAGQDNVFYQAILNALHQNNTAYLEALVNAMSGEQHRAFYQAILAALRQNNRQNLEILLNAIIGGQNPYHAIMSLCQGRQNGNAINALREVFNPEMVFVVDPVSSSGLNRAFTADVIRHAESGGVVLIPIDFGDHWAGMCVSVQEELRPGNLLVIYQNPTGRALNEWESFCRGRRTFIEIRSPQADKGLQATIDNLLTLAMLALNGALRNVRGLEIWPPPTISAARANNNNFGRQRIDTRASNERGPAVPVPVRAAQSAEYKQRFSHIDNSTIERYSQGMIINSAWVKKLQGLVFLVFSCYVQMKFLLFKHELSIFIQNKGDRRYFL